MTEQKIRCVFEIGCMDEPKELCDLEGSLLDEKGKVWITDLIVLRFCQLYRQRTEYTMPLNQVSSL